MTRKKRIGKETPPRITIRLDEETYHFYSTEAGQHRLDLSEYIRQMLIRGVISANVSEIQESFKFKKIGKIKIILFLMKYYALFL